jgi:hypothetical protein
MIARLNKNSISMVIREAPHKLTDERWLRIEKELQPLMANSSRRASGSSHFARLGGIQSARIEIEFLRSVALINGAAGHRYKSQDKVRRAAIIRSQRHITNARRELANVKQMALIRQVLKHIVEVELGVNYREPAYSSRDGFIENLILAWSQWGGRVSSSFREGRADGPLVRFLKACVDDLFPLTGSAARNRIQNIQKTSKKTSKKVRSIKRIGRLNPRADF